MTGTIQRGKAIRADLAHWDGRTRTFSRADASGGTVTGLVVDDYVDALQVFGQGDTYTKSTLAKAIEYIGDNTATVLIAPGVWSISSSLTFPSNISVRIPAGVDLQIESGATLRFDGSVYADQTDFYSGSGSLLINADSIVGGAPWIGLTEAEIALGITPVNFSIPSHDVLGYALVERYGTNTTPGTTDMAAAIQAANDVMEQAGGGVVVFPAGRIKTSAAIDRSLGVSFQGQGPFSTIMEGAHGGAIFQCINDPPFGDDKHAFVDGFTFKPSGAFTPSDGIHYEYVVFTHVRNVRYEAGLDRGEYMEAVWYSTFEHGNNRGDIGTYLKGTNPDDSVNQCRWTDYAWTGCADSGLVFDNTGGYGNEFDTCSFYSAPSGCTILDHIYSQGSRFVNCTFESNFDKTALKLRGGDDIKFLGGSMIDQFQFIDDGTFGARNVLVDGMLLWLDATVICNTEVTVRDVTYSLFESSPTAEQAADEFHLTAGRHTTGRQFAHFPGYINASAVQAKSVITPFGGVIPTGAYNRVGSWDMTSAIQWSGDQGSSGATDPFGGTSAYSFALGDSTQHGGASLGSAATGRTFTFQVWAKFLGSVRLGIGTSVGSIKKFAYFRSSVDDWHLLSLTYTSATDTDTTPLMSIAFDQSTVVWRPCHYESFGPLPALQPTRNLASIVGPIQTEDTRLVVYGSSAPAAGAFVAGDKVWYVAPAANSAPGAICTSSGSPGTWKDMASIAA